MCDSPRACVGLCQPCCSKAVQGLPGSLCFAGKQLWAMEPQDKVADFSSPRRAKIRDLTAPDPYDYWSFDHTLEDNAQKRHQAPSSGERLLRQE